VLDYVHSVRIEVSRIKASAKQLPTVGRSVHYHSYGTPGGEYVPMPRAVIVTETYNEMEDSTGMMVGLCILNPTGQFFNRNVIYSEIPKPGHWSWPPRT